MAAIDHSGLPSDQATVSLSHCPYSFQLPSQLLFLKNSAFLDRELCEYLSQVNVFQELARGMEEQHCSCLIGFGVTLYPIIDHKIRVTVVNEDEELSLLSSMLKVDLKNLFVAQERNEISAQKLLDILDLSSCISNYFAPRHLVEPLSDSCTYHFSNTSYFEMCLQELFTGMEVKSGLFESMEKALHILVQSPVNSSRISNWKEVISKYVYWIDLDSLDSVLSVDCESSIIQILNVDRQAKLLRIADSTVLIYQEKPDLLAPMKWRCKQQIHSIVIDILGHCSPSEDGVESLLQSLFTCRT